MQTKANYIREEWGEAEPFKWREALFGVHFLLLLASTVFYSTIAARLARRP